MILFTSKPTEYRSCPNCEALEKRIDLSRVPDLKVLRLPESGAPDTPEERDALAEADFYDVYSVPTLVVAKQRVRDVFEILERLKAGVK